MVITILVNVLLAVTFIILVEIFPTKQFNFVMIGTYPVV